MEHHVSALMRSGRFVRIAYDTAERADAEYTWIAGMLHRGVDEPCILWEAAAVDPDRGELPPQLWILNPADILSLSGPIHGQLIDRRAAAAAGD